MLKILSLKLGSMRSNFFAFLCMPLSSRMAELKKISKEDSMKIRNMSFEEVVESGIVNDAWNPAIPHKLKSKQTTL
mgnify:CR=1 FL=1